MFDARFTVLVLIPLGCAVGANESPHGGAFEFGSGGGAGSSGGASVLPTGGNATAGTGVAAGGTFPVAGTFGNNAGETSSAGTPAGGTGGGSAGAPAGGAGSGAGGKASGGSPSGGSPSGGSPTAGTGGTGAPPTAFCDSAPKLPLPFITNEVFQPSGWVGDVAATSTPTVAPNACDTRAAGSVGMCTVWRYTPSAVTPAWSGVVWAKKWDDKFTHDDICLAAGATKVTFQARGAVGGEQVIFSAAGAAEVPFTLTNAWQEYAISLNGVQYNTFAEGVPSGFFWKVAPPTPGGAAVTFFVDDIQFVK